MLNLELKIIFSKCLDLHIFFRIYTHIHIKKLQKEECEKWAPKEKKRKKTLEFKVILSYKA